MAQGQESRQRTGHGLAVHPGYALYNALNCVSGYSADWTSPGQAARMVRLARGRSRLGGCPRLQAASEVLVWAAGWPRVGGSVPGRDQQRVQARGRRRDLCFSTAGG